MIEFQLDETSGVATYLQLVQQVRQALRLGLLVPGERAAAHLRAGVTSEPVHDPAWTVRPVSLEELVLAYMSSPHDRAARRPRLGVVS